MSSVLDVFRFRRKNTPLHRLDPRAKFAILVLFSAASLILNDLASLLLVLAAEVALLAVARSAGEWLRSLKGLSMLVAMILALNYLTLPSNRLFTALTLALRFICLTTAFSVFFLTTAADELATALEASGLPREYSIMFTMSLRFVPSLARDLQTISDALRCRGLELEKGGLRTRIRNYTYLLVPLIVYELRRSLMIAEALEARGFGALKRVEPYVELRLGRADYAAIATSCTLLALTVALRFTSLYEAFVRLQLSIFGEL